ncbi:helix-turn-helix domain-containing protein [Aquimarina sp. 2201CG5-10]|uniref:helix-turn-helix domain-containing protein n=1 Tax=Aquimarina callyspongiae TaxID=3098150 RepID=UPI002AB4B686|nr:helix-turn-helix domain-containing protein [Aquimarina sp. 2201CG5-10]MDY8138361.1 helix-turn-helix domain-containing protein [Aquimarina sp. 2201CG5-10]
MSLKKVIPILNIGQFETTISNDNFYSNDFEKHLIRNGDMIYKPHSHDFYLCVLFTSGSGIHEIDFNTYDITPGSVFFLKPGQTHCWEFKETPKGYIFFHTKDFYELCLHSNLSQFPFYFTHENPPYLRLNNEQTKNIQLLFNAVNAEYKGNDIYKYQRLNSLINLIYIDLSRHYTNQDSDKIISSKTYLKTLEKLQTILEEFFKTEKSPKFYADKLNVTTKHLNRITKSTIDKTCSTVIKERVLLEAKRLLVHSNNTLSSIAEILGFEDYSYFSKVFKENTGITPFEFRKRY